MNYIMDVLKKLSILDKSYVKMVEPARKSKNIVTLISNLAVLMVSVLLSTN